jgi:hypothetical protein
MAAECYPGRGSTAAQQGSSRGGGQARELEAAPEGSSADTCSSDSVKISWWCGLQCTRACCICCICISAQSGHVYSHHVQIYSHTHSNQLEGGPGGVILDSTATGSIRTATSGLCRHHHAIRTFLLGITDLSVHYARSRTILSTDVAQPRQGVRACSGN